MGLDKFTGMSLENAERLYGDISAFRDVFRKELYDFRIFLDRAKSIVEPERGNARQVFSQGELLFENLNSFLGDETARQEFINDKRKGKLGTFGVRGLRTKEIENTWRAAQKHLGKIRRTKEKLERREG